MQGYPVNLFCSTVVFQTEKDFPESFPWNT